MDKQDKLAELFADHFPTGLRGSYERTAGGIVVDTGMKTDCYCGWSAHATDEHEVRHQWGEHTAAAVRAHMESPEVVERVAADLDWLAGEFLDLSFATQNEYSISAKDDAAYGSDRERAVSIIAQVRAALSAATRGDK